MATGRSCSVSFYDESGVRHEAEVIAESVYEAMVLELLVIRQNSAAEPEPLNPVEVQLRLPSLQQTVTLRQIREWLTTNSTHPKERELKQRLQQIQAAT